MNKNKAMLTGLALGAAYLMRNEKSRNKLMTQFKSLGTAKKSK
ncbi:hypothetical protein [Siminovitchia fordii]|uniref:DUF3918 domain-containing protein n=1 Tax=Siminovitchia fordii TaxID=254759 RepID=A0ABQ4K438_9BACI|nr:hypothetical protein [Siminovitchia fordii]GIN19633.1 hypothetical protein J1TS3_07670 [Siminovitchia fordii]